MFHKPSGFLAETLFEALSRLKDGDGGEVTGFQNVLRNSFAVGTGNFPVYREWPRWVKLHIAMRKPCSVGSELLGRADCGPGA